MAKQTKKVTKKAAPKPKARKAPKPARKPQGKAKARRSSPRAVPLPGMEQALHTRLNKHCAAISDIRVDLNQNRADEAEECQGALDYMHANSITTYRHAGVELVRVPGEEKLRVRTSKEPASAETEGSGQDAGEIGEALTKDDEADEAEAADLEG